MAAAEPEVGGVGRTFQSLAKQRVALQTVDAIKEMIRAGELGPHQALPPEALWSAFGIGREQFPIVAQAVLLGGNVRVGLEDNLYLSKGVYASNAQLVEKARTIVEAMGARILTPAQAREKLQLR